MARKKQGGAPSTSDYRHDKARRKNIPTAKLAAHGKAEKPPKAEYSYSPHRPPALRFDRTAGADRLPDLIAAAGQRPLEAHEQRTLAEALASHEPWLEWAGKQEEHRKGGFEVEPVALHIHERVSAKAIVRAAMREDVQRDLFADPKQPFSEAVQFYKHDVDWANRLILGDALEVMTSLRDREGLVGQVQLIYIDPPYGISFQSNFQPVKGNRLVKDRDQDLVRQPEMVKAYRDTWHLGVHSYLTYLRDRFIVAKGLLKATGSIFVQIGDENVHLVRSVLDEVFGRENFVSEIVIQKTGGLGKKGLTGVADFLLWYASDAKQVTYNQVLLKKEVGVGKGSGGRYSMLEFPNGSRRSLSKEERTDAAAIPEQAISFRYTSLKSDGFRTNTTIDYELEARSFHPGNNNHWKTTKEGLTRLLAANRIAITGKSIEYVRRIDDFAAFEVTNIWTGFGGAPEKLYVVQTSASIVERVLLMASNPGDLVLDPTCGSGTTAFAAEKWGRRWITCDTSRVALTVARQRMLTARFDYFRLAEEQRGVDGGFVLDTLPHITLGSIANNQHLDPIFERHQPVLDAALESCSQALGSVSPSLRGTLRAKLEAKAKTEGKRAVTDADQRRWSLPPDRFEHWTVPFATDPDWPGSLSKAVTAYRRAWRTKMDQVKACIDEHAEQDALVDSPKKVSGLVRVSGPFTVEGVRPEELAMDEDGLFDPTPNEFDDDDAGPDPASTNASAYLDEMVRLIKKDGVTFLGNEHRTFARVTALFDHGSTSPLHAEAAWEGDDLDNPDRVAIAFGPQYGPVTAAQIEDLIYAASRGYEQLVVCGFSFTADASALVRQTTHPRLRVDAAFIRPDLNVGMRGLLKDGQDNQLFTVFGLPDISVEEVGDLWHVRFKGVEIYDPLRNKLITTHANRVAGWFLDQDYDGRCFCITQAFFPDKKAWTKIAKALKSSADPKAFDAFSGATSVPFAAGEHGRIAVKVVDPRGNEVMTVRRLGS